MRPGPQAHLRCGWDTRARAGASRSQGCRGAGQVRGAIPPLGTGAAIGATEDTAFIQGARGPGACAGAGGGFAGRARSGHRKAPRLLLPFLLPGHLSEDPKFPKVPWPTPDLCPACHEEVKGLHSWNEGEVLLFLKQHYSPNNLVDTYAEAQADASEGGGPPEGGARERGRASPDRPRGDPRAESARPPSVPPPRARLSEGPSLSLDGRLRSASGAEGRGGAGAAVPFLGTGFSSLDMSLCVVLYVASSLFLMVMYFFFRVRSRRWKVRHPRPSV